MLATLVVPVELVDGVDVPVVDGELTIVGGAGGVGLWRG